MNYISVIQASLLYKVTNATVYNWIKEDGIQKFGNQYRWDDIQAAYDKRHKPKTIKVKSKSRPNLPLSAVAHFSSNNLQKARERYQQYKSGAI